MSTSPDGERQENSVCETINGRSSVENCKIVCVNTNLDGQYGKLNNSANKECTVGLITNQNDCQDKIVSNDSKVNGSDEKTSSDVQLHLDKDKNSADDASVNKEQTPVRIILTSEELLSISKEELTNYWLQQNEYILHLLSHPERSCNEEIKTMEANEEKYKVQLAELHKKEQYHAMRLTTKEHELQDLVIQTEELKACMAGASLKQCMLDPATNLLIERMKRDLDATKAKMEETQNELAAWKFTPDSNTGKQLMAKCRLLIKENEELGKMISSGRLSKLEGDLALQRNFSEEFKKSQTEVDEFLQEMDEDTEGMQGTILFLQSQLRQAKEHIAQLNDQIVEAAPLQQELNGASAPPEDAAAYPNGTDGEADSIADPQEESLLINADGGDELPVQPKRTRSAVDDEFDSPDMCTPYKRERTKPPQLVENGL